MSTSSRMAACTEEEPAWLISLREKRLERSPVETVPISSLVEADSPRLAGEDADHIRMLAESGTPLPPIVVHRKTLQVVDGMHRLRAAVLRDQDHIDVQFYDGDEGDIFLLSVAANTAHGLPLSLADRTAAAERIVTAHPHWSDRVVASVAGLSAKKVAELRRQSADRLPQFTSRVGRDGRSRPLDSSLGRERAGELIRRDPGASLRQIARAAGISPATAADVRDRLRRGEEPVPPRQRGSGERADRVRRSETLAVVRRNVRPKSLQELTSVFDALRRDPSLRFSETGRTVLRMFEACGMAARDHQGIVQKVPTHCAGSMADLAHGYAEILESFAEELQQLNSVPAVQLRGSVS